MGIGVLDPPHHTRLRKIVAYGFTPRRIRALQERVEELVDTLIDAMNEHASGSRTQY